MATDPFCYTKSYSADATLGKYTAVKKGSTANSIAAATAATDKVLGVLGSLGATSGQQANVVVFGPCKVLLGGSVVAGDVIVATTAGALIAATRHTHTENTAGSYTQNATTGAAAQDNTLGVMLEDGVSGDYPLAFITRGTA